MPLSSNILKLKQKLKAQKWLPEGLTPRQQRLAWALGGLFLLTLLYLAVVLPLLALDNSWSQELARKRQLLVRYQALQENKAKVGQALQALKNAASLLEGQFLSGANAAVASADLQEILKNVTGSHGVQVTSIKVLQPKDAGPYQEVPVQVQLTGTVEQLLTVLYHLEHHKKLLFIPELEINSPRWAAVVPGKDASVVQVSLVVTGVIKKGKGV
jgi:type II secretory pathway component PulM